MDLSKILIVPDSFKGTMSSIEVSNIIEQAILNIFNNTEIIKVPMADGGEGTVDAFLCAVGGKKITIEAVGPLFEKINASYAILSDGNTAVIEMAETSGLILVGDKKDPSKTTTYGTGQLIKDALDKGCKKIIVGIGGSATNDGGIGMAAALGVKFLDKEDIQIPLNGAGLKELNKIDVSGLDKRIKNTDIIVACDVDNPLYGQNGAAYIYAPQKGANTEMVEMLDDNLQHYAKIVSQQLGIDIQNIEGAGAAGGLGAGLAAFTEAKLESGIKIMLDTVKFDGLVENADLVITGEGRIDGQSLRGKVPVGIANRAYEYKVPVIAIVGAIGEDIEKIYQAKISSVFSINREPMEFDEAKKHSKENLQKTTEAIMRLIKTL